MLCPRSQPVAAVTGARRFAPAKAAGELLNTSGDVVEVLRGRSELSNLGKVLYLLQLRFATEHPALVKIKEAIRHLFPG